MRPGPLHCALPVVLDTTARRLRRALPGFQVMPQSTLRFRGAFSARQQKFEKHAVVNSCSQNPKLIQGCLGGSCRKATDAEDMRECHATQLFVPRSLFEGARKYPTTRSSTSTRRDQRPSHSGEAAVLSPPGRRRNGAACLLSRGGFPPRSVLASCDPQARAPSCCCCASQVTRV